MASVTVPPEDQDLAQMTAVGSATQIAGAWLSLGHAVLWAFLLFRWMTFGSFGWDAFDFENALATFPGLVPYILYGGLAVIDLAVGVGILREMGFAKPLGLGRSAAVIVLALIYWFITREFYGAIVIAGLAGFVLLLLTDQYEWSVNYPAAYWLVVFFVLPNVIVFVMSFMDRGARGTVVFPNIAEDGAFAIFENYARFFSTIGGRYLYLRIFWRSIWLATANTIICLMFGYPFAYWIARQKEKWRGILIFLVMIPFWTNFLVRTFAWMLLLRDSGLINNFWTSTLHDQAVALSGSSAFFAWLAEITADPLPLLFNQGSVLVGLFYGFFPFVVLPIYANLEKLDWSLLEAAADLGANSFQSTIRVLFPLSMPGIIAAAIIVFVPSLGAYVTPDLMGGGQVSMLGNLLQQ